MLEESGEGEGSVRGLFNGKGIWWVEHKIVELEKRVKSRDHYCINGIRSLGFGGKCFITVGLGNNR